MSRASKNVYHPNGDANTFQTVEEALDNILYGASAKIAGNVGSTDNRLVRADGTGGKTVQGSAITVDDSGNLTGVGTINTNPVFSTATAAQYRANTSGDRALTPTEVWSAMAVVALTDAATIAIDLSTSFDYSVSIAGNRTLGNPTNVKAGQRGRIAVTASSSTRTLNKGSNWKSSTAISWPLSIPSGQTFYVYYDAVSSTVIVVTGVVENPT